MKAHVILLAVLLIGTPAAALERGDIIEGPTRMIDGDTLDVEGVRVRLNGNRN